MFSFKSELHSAMVDAGLVVAASDVPMQIAPTGDKGVVIAVEMSKDEYKKAWLRAWFRYIDFQSKQYWFHIWLENNHDYGTPLDLRTPRSKRSHGDASGGLGCDRRQRRRTGASGQR